MFGLSVRRSAVLVTLACAGLGAGVVVAVQASAAGGTPKVSAPHAAVPTPTVPVRPQGASAQVQPHVTATNVHCGQVIAASVTLNGDLACAGTALTITANSINLNLGGHEITSTDAAGIGVVVSGKSDTLQNGVISFFNIGVEVLGTTDTVLNLRAVQNYNGIFDAGAGTKITTSTIAQSQNNGLTSTSSGATYSGDHVVSNNDGIIAFGSNTIITGSVANANNGWGIYDGGTSTTLTKNTASFNGGDGIRVAETTAVDGGGNTAKGNDYNTAFTPIQCYGVVCS